ncbi:CU044_2847 family protein [Streptomyces sp. NPDC000594]|uniref:CU044_2847 family protein n=1 Tax=Streptomyces sp. NPDC000594 TaxID=3154261 RepID=UPI003334213E
MAGGDVLTAVELPDGSRLLIQAADAGGRPEGVGDGDGDGEPLEEEVGMLTFGLDQVTAALGGFAQGITGALRSAQPHRLTVEFGARVGVESGGLVALITKGSMDANLTVTLEWDWTDTPPAERPGAEGRTDGGRGSAG